MASSNGLLERGAPPIRQQYAVWNDAHEFASRVEHLLESPELVEEIRGRSDYILGRYSSELVSRMWERVISEGK